MSCKPPCKNCPIPYTCKDGNMPINMYERPVSLLEYFEAACDWVWLYKLRIFSAFIYVSFAVVLYFVYFWR